MDLSELQGVGEAIKGRRRERGLSQEALAAPDFTKSYISAVERGKVRPSLKALAILAPRLGASVADLVTLGAPVDVGEFDSDDSRTLFAWIGEYITLAEQRLRLGEQYGADYIRAEQLRTQFPSFLRLYDNGQHGEGAAWFAWVGEYRWLWEERIPATLTGLKTAAARITVLEKARPDLIGELPARYRPEAAEGRAAA